MHRTMRGVRLASVLGATLLVCWASFCAAQEAAASKPNIVFILADDLGYFEAGFQGNPLANTPNMDELARDGVILNRHYAESKCAPSRASFLSGRLPVHVFSGISCVNKDACGLDLRMTTIAEKLKSGGYATCFAGKWHAGFRTEGHLPINRGFDYSFGFLSGRMSYYSHYYPLFRGLEGYDLWSQNGPALGYDGIYSDDIFAEKSIEFINNVTSMNDPPPFFVYHAFQNPHAPEEVPPEFEDPSIENDLQRLHYAKVHYMDTKIGEIVQTLKDSGAWENTLLVFASDNGGSKFVGVNYPLRGFKRDEFEGGMRTLAFAAGPLVPESLRGTRSETIVHIADWYATFATMAQVDPVDRTSDVPPSDSIDVWPLIVGGKGLRRKELVLTKDTVLGGKFKLVGNHLNGSYSQPNHPVDAPVEGTVCELDGGCLFDIEEDPTETTDLAAEKSVARFRLRRYLRRASKSFFASEEANYHGNYTNCLSSGDMLKLTGNFLSPLCYMPPESTGAVFTNLYTGNLAPAGFDDTEMAARKGMTPQECDDLCADERDCTAAYFSITEDETLTFCRLLSDVTPPVDSVRAGTVRVKSASTTQFALSYFGYVRSSNVYRRTTDSFDNVTISQCEAACVDAELSCTAYYFFYPENGGTKCRLLSDIHRLLEESVRFGITKVKAPSRLTHPFETLYAGITRPVNFRSATYRRRKGLTVTRCEALCATASRCNGYYFYVNGQNASICRLMKEPLGDPEPAVFYGVSVSKVVDGDS